MKLPLFFLLFLFSLSLPAQKGKAGNYKKYPYWIEMMNDSNVNYFEAVKAYEIFWKGKRKPLEEDELIGQEKTTAANAEKESRHEIREREREKKMYRKYGLDCKKFEHWKMQVKPYVQENGHILTRYERLKLWEENRKK